MLVYLVYAAVPVAVYLLLPRYTQRFSKKPVVLKKLLLIAGVLFSISHFLPTPLIHGQDTQFSTHFIGGGIFSGLVWLFIKKNLRLDFGPALELLSLYFLVSGLGVANELFEFAADELGFGEIPSGDTWWDLLANTLGALFFWIGYKIIER
ncbi:hypothetical protein A3F05_03605 [Candidatus Saccharibacteria bacterium RIFCSPHIGHO2_12_FULL_47_17]|nr:MAG: hypothetical protein A3F05_03605 [Candidatus Saccharibacteria bacterium RIFCSPHIGHO2_12_FULL_47_17]